MKSLLLSLALGASTLAATAATSEEQAVATVKALPEFIHYAASHESTFDDNALVTERGELPDSIALPAWRMDVHTVVHDPLADHLSLWNRFVLDSSGELYTWDRVADRMVTLTEWRKITAAAENPSSSELPGEAHWSPDKLLFAAWFDHNGGKPLGVTRSIVLRSASDPDTTLFSYVGPSRSTRAAWNSTSTACVIAQEVNWEKTMVWLVSKDTKDQWQPHELKVIAPIEVAYRRAIGDKDHPGFRVHLEKIEWLTGTQVQFHVAANRHDSPLASSGTWQVSVDTGKPDAEPKVLKLENR